MQKDSLIRSKIPTNRSKCSTIGNYTLREEPCSFRLFGVGEWEIVGTRWLSRLHVAMCVENTFVTDKTFISFSIVCMFVSLVLSGPVAT